MTCGLVRKRRSGKRPAAMSRSMRWYRWGRSSGAVIWKLCDSLLNDLQGMRETQLIRIDRRQAGGLMHREPDCIMGDEQGVEFLHHA